MLGFKGLRLEVEIFRLVVFFMCYIGHPIGFGTCEEVIRLNYTCGLSEVLGEVFSVVVEGCGEDPFWDFGGVGEMIVMRIFVSDLSGVLFIGLIDAGVVSPVVDFVVMPAAEFHSG
jgi:hypothetical protein